MKVSLHIFDAPDFLFESKSDYKLSHIVAGVLGQ